MAVLLPEEPQKVLQTVLQGQEPERVPEVAPVVVPLAVLLPEVPLAVALAVAPPLYLAQHRILVLERQAEAAEELCEPVPVRVPQAAQLQAVDSNLQQADSPLCRPQTRIVA